MLIDVTRLLDRALKDRRPTGVDRVGLEYVRRYGPRARALVRFAGRWVISSRASSARLFSALLAPSTGTRKLIRWTVATSYAANWRAPGPGEILVNTGHSGLHDPSYAARVRQRRLRAIYFVHDLIPITHPEYSRPGEDRRHGARLRTMLETGSGIVANSQVTANELAGHAAKCGLAMPPVAVAPLAPATLSPAAETAPLAQPYFVVLGTIEPRKNHLLLLNAWRRLAQELGERAPRLVVIGQRGWECEQVVDMLERCEQLRGLVLERPGCSDAELAVWLAHARALLFPSFAEGFGLPLAEALSAGLPVLASDLPAFREIAGGIPDYLDPLDGPSWIRAVMAYAELDGPERRAQRLRMKGWTAPAWNRHFAIVDALFERVSTHPM
jgi:glycosyltransferase involved in cell wall biosynthesis